MNHSEMEELLSAYADGELTPAQREAVELHLTGCADCQRTLAEFRLTSKQLALLADPTVAITWRPDVVARVTARIQRRRRWIGLSRRLAFNAVGALAVGCLIMVALWLLQHLPTMPAQDDASDSVPAAVILPSPTIQSTLEVSQATNTSIAITYVEVPELPIYLEGPDNQFTLFLFDADLLVESPADGAVCNLGYRLSSDVPGAFVVVETGGEQIALNPDEAPSIYLPAGAQSGDTVWLFAATPNGETTPAAAFTPVLNGEGWQAFDLGKAAASPTLQVELPTPAPEAVDPSSPSSFSILKGPDVMLRLERVTITPDQPRQGQPFTVTAVIRNAGDVDARVPVWFSAYVTGMQQSPYPIANSRTYYLTIPAGEMAKFNWGGKDQWGQPEDLSLENHHLVFRAGVNILHPSGRRFTLAPETDKSDNETEIAVDFLPYQPLVSDNCPPGDNVWLGLSQSPVYQPRTLQPVLQVIVHNEGNVEAVHVPLRATDAAGYCFLTYARWVLPCGGTVRVDMGMSADQLTYPVTVTLNPTDTHDALPESDRSDNEIVIGADETCVGPTDLWLTDDDVTIEGDDLLVMVHLSGSPPRESFWLRVYHTKDGRTLASEQVRLTTCDELLTVRFESVLAGLSGGYVLVQIDTEANRVESVYPQHNNTATVPLP